MGVGGGKYAQAHGRVDLIVCAKRILTYVEKMVLLVLPNRIGCHDSASRKGAKMADVIETERLTLRPRTEADLEANLKMDLDPEVHRYIFSSAPDPAEHRAEILSRIVSGWPQVGGLWVVEWRDRPGFLGWCALFPFDSNDQLEMGYRLLPQAWGQGIATEAGQAILNYGFSRIELDTVIAVSHPNNARSQNVLKKLGFCSTGAVTYHGQTVTSFLLTRANFETLTVALSND